MSRAQIQNSLHTHLVHCTALMATCLADARDNTHCPDVEIRSLAQLMRVSAELATALAKLRRQGGKGVPPPRGSNGIAP